VRAAICQSRLIAPASASRALLEYSGVEQRPKHAFAIDGIRHYSTFDALLLPAASNSAELCAHRASAIPRVH
jgi:hypothetical protein